MYKKLKMVMLTVFAAGGFAVLGAATAYTTMTKIHLFNSLIDSTPIGQTLAAAVNTTGLSVNGSAPNQHVLCGNGSVYGDCGGVTGLSLNNSTITGGTISGASITASPISGQAGSFTTLQLNGAGPNNHLLCGNGTSYIDCTTITSITIQNSTINGSTLNSPTISTPAITGGTITNPAITGGTMGSATLNGNVITAGTISNAIIGNSSITGTSANLTSLQLNSAAPSGQVLVGDGTHFVPGPVPGAGASSLTTPNGYATMPGGLIIEWVQGGQQADAGGSGNTAQTLTFPLAFPHAFLGASCAAYTTGEASGNDTYPSTQQPKSWNTTSITVQRYRLADHGSDPSAPICTVFGY